MTNCLIIRIVATQQMTICHQKSISITLFVGTFYALTTLFVGTFCTFNTLSVGTFSETHCKNGF